MWCGFHLVSRFFLFGGLATPPNRKRFWPVRLAFTDQMLEGVGKSLKGEVGRMDGVLLLDRCGVRAPLIAHREESWMGKTVGCNCRLWGPSH